MVKRNSKTVAQYLQELPTEQNMALSTVREVILKNLPYGYQETINWGMISYEIPLSRYPNTYNRKPLLYAALAAQKNYMAIYLTGLYHNKAFENWFREAYQASGKKLDMGKSCIRFRKLDDLAVDLIGEAIAGISVEAFIENYWGYLTTIKPIKDK